MEYAEGVSTTSVVPVATPDLLSEEDQLFYEECMELFNHFNHKCLEAILKATKHSLDIIRKRVFFSGLVYNQ